MNATRELADNRVTRVFTLFHPRMIICALTTNLAGAIESKLHDGGLLKGYAKRIDKCIGANTCVEARQHRWRLKDGTFVLEVAGSLDDDGPQTNIYINRHEYIKWPKLRTLDGMRQNLRIISNMFYQGNLTNCD